MRKIAVAVAALGISLVGFAAPAQAAQTDPGTPGDKNCVGQTTAYLAQLVPGTPGIGNLAKAADASVKEIKVIVKEYCGA